MQRDFSNQEMCVTVTYPEKPIVFLSFYAAEVVLPFHGKIYTCILIFYPVVASDQHPCPLPS